MNGYELFIGMALLSLPVLLALIALIFCCAVYGAPPESVVALRVLQEVDRKAARVERSPLRGEVAFRAELVKAAGKVQEITTPALLPVSVLLSLLPPTGESTTTAAAVVNKAERLQSLLVDEVVRRAREAPDIDRIRHRLKFWNFSSRMVLARQGLSDFGPALTRSLSLEALAVTASWTLCAVIVAMGVWLLRVALLRQQVEVLSFVGDGANVGLLLGAARVVYSVIARSLVGLRHQPLRRVRREAWVVLLSVSLGTAGFLMFVRELPRLAELLAARVDPLIRSIPPAPAVVTLSVLFALVGVGLVREVRLALADWRKPMSNRPSMSQRVFHAAMIVFTTWFCLGQLWVILPMFAPSLLPLADLVPRGLRLGVLTALFWVFPLMLLGALLVRDIEWLSRVRHRASRGAPTYWAPPTLLTVTGLLLCTGLLLAAGLGLAVVGEEMSWRWRLLLQMGGIGYIILSILGLLASVGSAPLLEVRRYFVRRRYDADEVSQGDAADELADP